MWMLQWWPLLRRQEDRAAPLGNWKEDDDGAEQALGALTAMIAEAILVAAGLPMLIMLVVDVQPAEATSLGKNGQDSLRELYYS